MQAFYSAGSPGTTRLSGDLPKKAREPVTAKAGDDRLAVLFVLPSRAGFSFFSKITAHATCSSRGELGVCS